VTYKERVVHGRVASEHLVEFFDSVETRARGLARYAVESLEAGDNVLVAAAPSHWAAAALQLRTAGFDIDALVQAGRLVVRDTNVLLPQLMRRGTPDPGVFDTLLGTTVRRLAETAHVSAYGELVDVLASHREFDAAARLEGLWNDLAEQVSFRLMCGYSAAHFVDGGAERLRVVCGAHTHVHANDPLGAWLLGLARLPFDSDPLPAA
jgi:MEDS: MEthanogen/methylotroph, DcmR Sensory domain